MELRFLNPGALKDPIVIFAPHDDDPWLRMKRTIRALLQEGKIITIGIFTDGRYGNSDPEPEEVTIERRKREAIDGYNKLGVTKWGLHFFNFPDIHFDKYKSDAILQAVTYLRAIKPKTIFIPSENDWHIDHKVSFLVCENAVRQAQNPNMGGGRNTAITVKQVFAYGVWNMLKNTTHIFTSDPKDFEDEERNISDFSSQKMVIDMLSQVTPLEAFQEMPEMVMRFHAAKEP